MHEGVEWEPDLVRAALPMTVLGLLSRHSSHGYALVEALHSHGFGRVRGGTLYPLLRRLEEQQLVDVSWDHSQSGPGRKVLSITARGREELHRAVEDWLSLGALISTITGDSR